MAVSAFLAIGFSLTVESFCTPVSSTCTSGGRSGVEWSGVGRHDSSILLQKTLSVHQESSSETLDVSERLLMSRRGLCLKGHIVPELFILGAQKAGTTSLSAQLNKAPGITFGHFQNNPKEAHIFEKDDEYHQGVDAWIERYPACTSDGRVVAVDATPNYLINFHTVPFRIQERYGEETKHLKFVVILRDPLARMQSAFYHYRRDALHWQMANGLPLPQSVMENVFNKSFQEYIEWVVRTKGEHTEEEDIFRNTLYADQITAFLENFDAGQFTIAPFKSVVRDGSFADHVIEMFGLPPIRPAASHDNVGEHAPLEEELSLQLMDQARSLLNNVTGAHRIGQVLTSQQGKAVHLFGFRGDRSSADDIARWLSDAW